MLRNRVVNSSVYDDAFKSTKSKVFEPTFKFTQPEPEPYEQPEQASPGINNNSPLSVSPKYSSSPAPPAKLKILIVTPVFPPYVSVGGGVSITYGALSDKLTARGHEVHVLSPRLGNMENGWTNLYLGFPVMLSNWSNFKFLSKYFDECDVVVAPDNDLLMILCFLSHWKNKPLLFATHTNFKVLLEGGSFCAKYIAAPIMDNCAVMFSHLATQAWTTSPSYMSVLEERGYRIKGVFSPRIKLSIFEKDDDEEDVKRARVFITMGVKCDVVLFTAGRWSHEKRINLLVKSKPKNMCLVICGDGPESEAAKILSYHDVANGVIVHRGMVNQDRLRVLYKAADFLVSASAFETLGMTVAEAHLCGTPVIVERAPGFVSQVVEGENGFLVNFEDSNISKIIENCIKRKPSRNQIFKTILERWDNQLPNYENIVEDLANSGDRKEWNCLGSKIPIFLWIPFALIYWIIYQITAFPFVYGRVKRTTESSNAGDLLDKNSKLC